MTRLCLSQCLGLLQPSMALQPILPSRHHRMGALQQTLPRLALQRPQPRAGCFSSGTHPRQRLHPALPLCSTLARFLRRPRNQHRLAAVSTRVTQVRPSPPHSRVLGRTRVHLVSTAQKPRQVASLGPQHQQHHLAVALAAVPMHLGRPPMQNHLAQAVRLDHLALVRPSLRPEWSTLELLLLLLLVLLLLLLLQTQASSLVSMTDVAMSCDRVM